ncbi:MAG: phosphoglycerate kinase [Patescibacteria group bacterium]|nr:phosphoglycerate kinase [Patescibacteria group bacterium]
MKKLESFDFKGKNVLVRCDFNVPISNEGQILDNFRIKMALPTIEYLVKEKARVILMSHLETKTKKPSLKYVVPELEKLLGQKIELFPNYLGKNARKKIGDIEQGRIILLENLRFNEGEKNNDKEFAKTISSLGDIFVNEAFSVCHRNHASIVSIPKYLPSTTGMLFEKEVKVLSKVSKKPNRPFVIIIGGIKTREKIRPILNILKMADHLLLGSKIGEAIFSEKGILIGRDFPQEKLINELDLTNHKIHLPVDGIISLEGVKEGYLRKGGIDGLRKKEEVFDIGPETIRVFKKIIKDAKTILWNGPLGIYEDEKFEMGTKEIANSIVENYSAFKVAGGGDTVSAIKKYNLINKFDFLSIAGSAMLQFLAGEKMPGIQALK